MRDTSNANRTVVVGTDASESSLLAVGRAGDLAGACGATPVIACASLPTEPDDREPAGAGAGAKDVQTVAVQGSPVETLLEVVRREADLLVVGSRGLAGIKGRLPGSVPADAIRRSECDVLVVHTTD